MKFAQNFEKNNQDIIQAALNSLFMQQMAKGTLSKKIFDYYITQESYFLTDFARVAGLCTSKCKDDDIPLFIDLQKSAYRILERMSSYYASSDDFTFTTARTPAQGQLSSFMLRLALHEPVEVALCGLAPLPWLYSIAGARYKDAAFEGHPYGRWLNICSSPLMAEALESYKSFINTSIEANPARFEAMSRALRISFTHMYHFWEDAYYMKDSRIF